MMLGLHLDLKWSMYRRRFLREIVRHMSTLGMDTILLEFENKIPLDPFQAVVHPDAWSREELKAFLRDCRAHRIQVIPKIPLMGHMEWLLQWPWWADMQENSDRREICPSHPRTAGVVARLLDQVLRLFPDAPFVHLGGDESFSLGTCPRCRKTGKPKGQLYLDHYLPLFRQAQKAGKRPLIYGDMILAHPEIIHELPRSVVIADWDYWSGTGPGRNVWGYQEINSAEDVRRFPKQFWRFRNYFIQKDGSLAPFPYAVFLKDQGFDVILMPSARCMGDNFCAPQTAIHVRNTRAAGQKAVELGLKGMIVTSWAVRFNHFQTNWPSIAAGAWSYHEPHLTLEQIGERFARRFWGLDCSELFEFLDLLSPALPDLHAGRADPYPPDIVHEYIRSLYKDPNSESCLFVERNLAPIKKSFNLAWKQLNRLAVNVRWNRRIFDHWLLAAETLQHKAQMLPAVLQSAHDRKISSRCRNNILVEIDKLADQYEVVFGRTMPRTSLDMERRLRFAEVKKLVASMDERTFV